MVLWLPKWIPNILLREHASAIPLPDTIRDLTFSFWIKHLSLGSWSSLWDLRADGLVSFADNLPCVSDSFDELGCRPQLICGSKFLVLITMNRHAVHIFTAGLPFQSMDLAAGIIVPHFADLI